MNRILIVDDEEIGRTVMEDIFGRYGKSVSVSTGKGALTVYEKAIERGTAFNLVLLDISLEDISGVEVLKKIKQIDGKRGNASAVVIMVTAHSERDLVVDSIKSGCKAYFIKPLKQETVDKKMSELGFSQVK